MPERQAPIMRAATSGERVRDWLRGLYEGAADQPLGQIADALGVSDLQGVADQEFGDVPGDGLKIAHASRKVPSIGGAGRRIKPAQQSALDPGLKIPRFRSPLGTFVKHEGQWWRLPKQPSDSPTITLERLPMGTPEPGVAPTVLESKTLRVEDFYQGVLDVKGTRLPKRRK